LVQLYKNLSDRKSTAEILKSMSVNLNDENRTTFILQRTDENDLYKSIEKDILQLKQKFQNASDFQIVAQTNEIVGMINKIVFNLYFSHNNGDNSTPAPYNEHTFYVGESIITTKNKKSENNGKPNKSSQVSNGDIFLIKKIYEIDLLLLERYKQKGVNDKSSIIGYKNCTSKNINSKRITNTMMKVLDKDGKKKLINLTQYGVHNIQRSYALTIHKMQGSSSNNVVLYIHRNFGCWLENVSFVVAVTRAVLTFTLIINYNFTEDGTLTSTELNRILNNFKVVTPSVLIDSMPSFQQKRKNIE
jgi:hypothetical protein